jgi:hypothetical protein
MAKPASVRVTVARSYSHLLVVTDSAIIRVERRSAEETRQASMIAFVVGGIVGPILAALADRIGMPGGPTRLYLSHKDTPDLDAMADVTTCWAADVPPEVAALPGWPNVESFRPVTFYPRALIAAVKLSAWQGLMLTLRREAAREVSLSLPVWQQARVREHLESAGYPTGS